MYPTALPLKSVQFHEGYLPKRISQVRDVTVPYQWEALNDRIPGAEPSGAVKNLRIAAGEEQGEFYGIFFQDSDLAKWVEAAAYSLAARADPQLAKTLGELAELYTKAQQPDGYFNTYFQLKEPGKRFQNLRDMHELYCAGHLIEAGIAHFRATNQRTLLNMVRRMADLFVQKFGPGPEQSKGYCGHQEIELSLVKLSRATGDPKYRKLAEWFIDQRGTSPSFFEEEAKSRPEDKQPWYVYYDGLSYWQAHKPVREQEEPVGHSVRAMYMYSAMADLAHDLRDASLAESCKRLWKALSERHLYITGGIGSDGPGGEKFTDPYDLPGDRAYAETCASIGLMFFARRMLDLELRAEYADLMERALYNNVLAGISLDATRFFYVNPLAVEPNVAKRRYDCKYVKTQRVPWFGCSCCPPNIARLLSSMSDYAFSEMDDGLAIHLYANSTVTTVIDGGRVTVKVATEYPWDGHVVMEVTPEAPLSFSLSLRLPGWAKSPTCRLNGCELSLDAGNTSAGVTLEHGYLTLTRDWARSDRIELNLPMEVLRLHPNPRLTDASGCVALQRGPLVYCLEEPDNGKNLGSLRLPAAAKISAERRPDLLGGCVTLLTTGERLEQSPHLYSSDRPAKVPQRIEAIPYALWANRGEGEMRVWIRE